MNKVCGQHQKLGRARQAREKQDSSDEEDDRKIEEVKVARTAAGTPPMLL